MKTTLERFNEKFIPVTESGCWLWIGATITGGYGYLLFNGKTVPAHRVSLILFKGENIDGKDVDHLCRVPCCVNPDHLEAVTHRENLLRGHGVPSINARKTACPKGHLYIPGNTKIEADGSRRCLPCRRQYDKKRRRNKILYGKRAA